MTTIAQGMCIVLSGADGRLLGRCNRATCTSDISQIPSGWMLRYATLYLTWYDLPVSQDPARS